MRSTKRLWLPGKKSTLKKSVKRTLLLHSFSLCWSSSSFCEREFLELRPPSIQKYLLTCRTGIGLAVSHVSLVSAAESLGSEGRKAPHITLSVWSNSVWGSSEKPLSSKCRNFIPKVWKDMVLSGNFP